MGFAGDWAGQLNGLLIGGSSAYDLQALTGWNDMTESPLGGAASLVPKQTRNGSWFVPSYMPQRVVTMVLQINAVSGAFEAAIDALRAATQPGVGEIELRLQVGGVSTSVQGTVTSRVIPTTLDYLAGYTAAQIEVTCSDPRRFGNTVFGSLKLPLSTGGITWRLTWPAVWNSTQISGTTTMYNPGNTNGLLLMDILGPVTGPTLAHMESGETFAFASTFTSPDELLIDMDKRTALQGGQSSRNGYIVNRGWLPFAPGNNTYSFNAATYTVSASVIISAVPAWI